MTNRYIPTFDLAFLLEVGQADMSGVIKDHEIDQIYRNSVSLLDLINVKSCFPQLASEADFCAYMYERFPETAITTQQWSDWEWRRERSAEIRDRQNPHPKIVEDER